MQLGQWQQQWDERQAQLQTARGRVLGDCDQGCSIGSLYTAGHNDLGKDSGQEGALTQFTMMQMMVHLQADCNERAHQDALEACREAAESHARQMQLITMILQPGAFCMPPA